MSTRYLFIAFNDDRTDTRATILVKLDDETGFADITVPSGIEGEFLGLVHPDIAAIDDTTGPNEFVSGQTLYNLAFRVPAPCLGLSPVWEGWRPAFQGVGDREGMAQIPMAKLSIMAVVDEVDMALIASERQAKG